MTANIPQSFLQIKPTLNQINSEIFVITSDYFLTTQQEPVRPSVNYYGYFEGTYEEPERDYHANEAVDEHWKEERMND